MFDVVAYQWIQKYMHMVWGMKLLWGENPLVGLSFLKDDWEMINWKHQKLPNQFLTKFKAVFENQAKELSYQKI